MPSIEVAEWKLLRIHEVWAGRGKLFNKDLCLGRETLLVARAYCKLVDDNVRLCNSEGPLPIVGEIIS